MNIELIGFRYHSSLDIDALCKVTENIFSTGVSFRKAIFDIGIAYDSVRAQYNSNILLSLLKKGKPLNLYDRRFMVVTDLDLFVPILTYVFGEAEFNGNFGVVSSFRLHQEYYGLNKNDSLLQSRIQKEIIHELGHNYGLIHCIDSKCVMHSSTYVEDIDFKDAAFCDFCKNQIYIV
jgi:archaemetzincin